MVQTETEKDIAYQLPGGTQEPSVQQTTSSPTASPTQSQSPSAFEGFVLDTVTAAYADGDSESDIVSATVLVAQSLLLDDIAVTGTGEQTGTYLL